MFEQELISNVVVKIRKSGKQQNFSIDLQINQSSQVDLTTFSAILKSLKVIEEIDMIFYFDHIEGRYIQIKDEEPFAPYSHVVKQNLIHVQIETMLSDQVLANPTVQQPSTQRSKRNREKTIEQAFILVDQWRKLYRQGTYGQKGEMMKINLDQAAEMINMPRKTLQDYYLLFRKGLFAQFKFKEHRRSKIGTLRSFLKQKGKQKDQIKEKFDQRKFFKLLTPQLVDSTQMINESQIFDILEDVNSDQDILFQN